jgi:DNA processing protein
MSRVVDMHIDALECMKKYPSKLYYKGNLELLNRPKVSIVGSRKALSYTKDITYKLSKALSNRGVCIVSGAAMGVDAIAHSGAKANNTIAVVANGLDIRYPKVNAKLIEDIENQGLVLSQFEDSFRATNWSFVIRNELVVALGDILIVTQADLDSGTMRSVEYAKKMDKEIFVLPHRLSDSSGTNWLLQHGYAKAIYDIDEFASRFGIECSADVQKDEFYYFVQSSPTFDSTVAKFGDRVYEAELEGIITIQDGIVRFV